MVKNLFNDNYYRLEEVETLLNDTYSHLVVNFLNYLECENSCAIISTLE